MLKVRNLMSLNFTHPDIIPAHQAGEIICTFVFELYGFRTKVLVMSRRQDISLYELKSMLAATRKCYLRNKRLHCIGRNEEQSFSFFLANCAILCTEKGICRQTCMDKFELEISFVLFVHKFSLAEMFSPPV